MSTFYSECVRHYMRFYARHPCPEFRSNIDKQNWLICKNVFREFSDEDKDILLTVYREKEPLSRNVHNISKDKCIKPDKIWGLIQELEYMVAKRMKLL